MVHTSSTCFQAWICIHAGPAQPIITAGEKLQQIYRLQCIDNLDHDMFEVRSKVPVHIPTCPLCHWGGEAVTGPYDSTRIYIAFIR